MKPMASDWYKKIWTLSIQDMSWVEIRLVRWIF